MREYYVRNKEAYTRRVRRCRQEVLDFFGRKCARCGFDDWRALNIDHIIPCLSKGRMNSTALRAFIRKNPQAAREQFQCLCANCNQIKTHENDERPGARTRKGVLIGRTDWLPGEGVSNGQQLAQ